MNDSIRFLGTSDGLPSADRHHASLLVRLAGQTILLDAGEPCSHTLKRMGEDFNAIDAVVLTHTHSDHVGGFPMLLQSMWLERRSRPLTVFLPARAIRPLRQWLRACYLFNELLQFPIRWRAISRRARLGAVNLRFFPTTHLATMPRHAGIGYDAFSVRLDTAGKSLGYSGDLGGAPDLRPLCARPLDLLVTELAHLSADRLIEVIRGRPIRHLVVTHLSRAARAGLPHLKTRLRALRPMRVSIAADGRTVSL